MYKFINQIMIGNNLDLLKQIDSNSIDLHFTSPPYADIKKYDNFDGIHPDKYVDWIMPRILEIERTLKETGNFILNINDRVVSKFRHPYVFNLIAEIHKQTKLRMWERLFWDKGKYLPHKSRFGDRVEYLFWFCKSDKFYLNIDLMRNPYNPISIARMKNPIKKRFNRNKENQDASEYKEWSQNPLGALPSSLISIGSESKRQSDNHCAIFPLKLPIYFINGACPPNGLVCDIFNGIGTTCAAAKQLNRNYIGLDQSELYCNEAKERLKKIETIV